LDDWPEHPQRFHKKSHLTTLYPMGKASFSSVGNDVMNILENLFARDEKIDEFYKHRFKFGGTSQSENETDREQAKNRTSGTSAGTGTRSYDGMERMELGREGEIPSILSKRLN